RVDRLPVGRRVQADIGLGTAPDLGRLSVHGRTPRRAPQPSGPQARTGADGDAHARRLPQDEGGARRPHHRRPHPDRRTPEGRPRGRLPGPGRELPLPRHGLRAAHELGARSVGASRDTPGREAPRVRDMPAPRKSEGAAGGAAQRVLAWPYRAILAFLLWTRVRPYQLTVL